jgi:N-acyl-D-amino-acid deacylase
LLLLPLALLLPACGGIDHDVIIRGGTIYDGTGSAPMTADLAIDGDRITAIGDLSGKTGTTEIDATGMAVSPGFINMLSWANVSLIEDGRSLSDIRQGVTLEVMGEGTSMGPLNEEMRQEKIDRQSDIKYDVSWTTLGEYLQHLETKGISTNVASFVGASQVRQHEIGYEDRAATPEELERMKALVRQAMEEGAVGLGTFLTYVPATFAPTEELIELAKTAAEYDGLYISHIRNEGDEIFEAIDEFLTVVREAGIRGEIYHLKVSHKRNWDKLDQVFQMIEGAQELGLEVTADMYTYHASSTGLNYDLPSWAKEGGHEAFVARLQDPETRAQILADTDMIPPEDILLVSFRNPDLRHLTGKTLAEISEERGTSPVETAMDLFVEDDSRIGTVRFTMNEDNIRKKIQRPWISFCSDSASLAPEPPFTNAQPHPRAYGSFARLLGKYVREEKLISLEEAIRRLSGFPAQNLKLRNRGLLSPNYFADIVVFDPETVTDEATFEVLADGEHTGAMGGRFVKGPGWKGQS